MNRVLIVDDEPSILGYMAPIINGIGYHTMVASSAKEALGIYLKESPGIVLTDLNLGDSMDGVSLCSRIVYENRSTVVIAMSGFFSVYDKAYCLEAGFGDFLSKPVSTDDLKSALDCAFARRSRWLKAR